MFTHTISKLSFAALTLLTLSGQAQDTQELSLEEAIQMAQSENNELAIKKQEIEIARKEHQQTNSLFLPKITISETGTQTDNPLYAFGNLLQQRSVTSADFNPDELNNPTKSVNWNTSFAIEQPLINIDGFYGRKAANLQIESLKQVSERTSQYITFHVKEAYFGIQLAKNQQQVIQKSLSSINESLRILNDKYAQGYLQKADLLKVEVRKLELENQLLEANNNIINANNQLSYLLTGKIGKQFTLTDNLQITESEEVLESITLSDNRADILAMEYASKAYNIQLKMNRSKFIPSLNAFGKYDLFDTQIFGNQANSYFVGISLNWKIFDGGANIASTQKASALAIKSNMELEKTKNQATLQLDQAKRATAVNKQKLETLETAIAQAEESYRLTNNFFLVGEETIDNLLLAETLQAQKKLAHQVALYEYYIALSNVQLQSK